MTDALILAGGVAKGAFGAGVLSVLLGPEGKARARTDVHSVVAASSGAVNGAFVASKLHAGTEEQEIARLASLWLDEASFGQVFDPSVSGLFGLKGASDERGVLDLLRGAIKPGLGVRPIELRLVVANLSGSVEPVGGAPATTFESVFTFDQSTFEDAAKLELMFRTVTASAAFPGAFIPVPLEIDGRTALCVDGGAVNNTPLRLALEHPLGIDRVFIVTPQPRVSPDLPAGLHGIGLASHLADMLVGERLYRDLRETYAVNVALAKLDTLVPDPALRTDVLDAIGWSGRRPLTVVELRPPSELPGGAFDGFFSRALREEYVRAGEESARAWLDTCAR